MIWRMKGEVQGKKWAEGAPLPEMEPLQAVSGVWAVAFSALGLGAPLVGRASPRLFLLLVFSARWASLFHGLHCWGSSLCLNQAFCQVIVKLGETQYKVLKLSISPSKMVLGSRVQCFHSSSSFMLQVENKMVEVQFPAGFC